MFHVHPCGGVPVQMDFHMPFTVWEKGHKGLNRRVIAVFIHFIIPVPLGKGLALLCASRLGVWVLRVILFFFSFLFDETSITPG